MSKAKSDVLSAGADESLSAIAGSSVFVLIVAIVMALATAALALLSSATTQPLVLTAMGVLAAFGAFFVFGLIAGHIQLAERTSDRMANALLVAEADHGLLVTTRKGTLIASNPAADRILGRTTAGLTRSVEEAFADHPRASEALFRMARAAEAGRARTEDVRLGTGGADAAAEDASGVQWLRIAVKPVATVAFPGETGPGFLWTLTDISTERARESRRVSSLEERLGSFDSIPLGAMVVDHEGRVTLVNGQLSRWLGLPADGTNRDLLLRDLLPGDGAELLRSLAREPSSSTKPVDLDLLTGDGRTWPATIFVRPTDANGARGAFTAAVIERRLEANRLADERSLSEQVLRMVQSAPFGIATIDKDGRITSTNGAFTRLMLDAGPATGQRALDVLQRGSDADVRAELAEGVSAALAGRGNIAPIEITLGDNQAFTRRVFLAPIVRSSSEQDGAIAYIVDATEQKTLEIRFAQSQKMEAVGKLAGGIAHDFNNMLTAIIGFSDLLLGTHRPGDPAYVNIKNIRSSADRAAELVGQLLAFSRRQTLQPEVLRLSDVVSDNSVLLHRLLGERVDLKIHAGRDLWAVKADKTQLGQVIINLAVNARDAMPGGGRLTIRTSNVSERDSQRLTGQGMVVGEYVMIEVEDTGTGMSQEVMEKIFEPFFTTKGVGKGTGLGLSTVYGIVKQTNGFIYPDSVIGKGTTFRVYIPRHHADPVADIEAAREAKRERQRDLTGTGRVLVVEDEDAVRMFAIEALKRQGYEVLSAADGYEALELMEACDHQVDLVVSDVIMPEMDGPTLMKELRQRRPDLKFVFVSGYPDDAFKHALDPDADFAFLPKPYSLAQIAATVKEHIAG